MVMSCSARSSTAWTWSTRSRECPPAPPADFSPTCRRRKCSSRVHPSLRTRPQSMSVILHTSHGPITIELDAERAPKTVANFLAYVRAGHFDNTLFHRVIDDFMIQGGGFAPDFTQKPTRPPVDNEAANGLKNKRYTVAMARTADPHSATAQFF